MVWGTLSENRILIGASAFLIVEAPFFMLGSLLKGVRAEGACRELLVVDEVGLGEAGKGVTHIEWFFDFRAGERDRFSFYLSCGRVPFLSFISHPKGVRGFAIFCGEACRVGECEFDASSAGSRAF